MSAIPCNESNTGRAVRIILALIIFAIGISMGSWFGLAGLIFLVTGIVGWCPIFALFGINTCTTASQ